MLKLMAKEINWLKNVSEVFVISIDEELIALKNDILEYIRKWH